MIYTNYNLVKQVLNSNISIQSITNFFNYEKYDYFEFLKYEIEIPYSLNIS